MKEFNIECPANNKGICEVGLANVCPYDTFGFDNKACRITNFTDFLLIKGILEIERD